MDSVGPALGTLEETGHIYSPFSGTDIWGAPSAFAFPSVRRSELPLGNVSSLPTLGAPEMLTDYKIGSAAQFVPPHTPKGDAKWDATGKLILFAVVVAFALYYEF